MDREKYVYFLSDLHLGAPYLTESKEQERRIVNFLDHIKQSAKEIYLLGDILDYWFEYRYAVPRGFVRFFGKLAELSDSGVKITWLIGNHDIWIFDYIPDELGVEVIDGSLVKEIGGKKFFMAHGDGVGKLPPVFRFIRATFRNKTCQFLYSGIHPRWTIPFAYRWSRHSRKKGEGRGVPDERLIASITEFSRSYLHEHEDINYFIYGHIHVLKREPLGPDCELIVLGDWLHLFSYARFGAGGGLELFLWNDKTQSPEPVEKKEI